MELSRRLRQKYTVPSAKENWSPTSKYSLRGIVVSPDKFYFCQREAQPQPQSRDGETAEGDDHAEAEAESKGKDKETEEDAGPVPTPSPAMAAGVDQWWMVSYNARDASPITVVVSALSFYAPPCLTTRTNNVSQKTTVDVTRASVFQETSTPILVYSNDASLAEENTALSDALRTFVRFDNRFFKQEVLEESPRDKKRQPAEEASPTSPLKRQQRSSSIDSMASNMASLGEYSDRDMEDVPLLSNDRSLLDMEDGMFARGGNGYNVHEWAMNRTMEEAIAKRTETDGADWADPVLPQREVDSLPEYDEVVADHARTVVGDAKLDHRGSLGTEMVQLAIHAGGTNGVNGTNGTDGINNINGANDADAGNATPRATTSSPDHTDANQMQELSQTPGQMLPPPPPRTKKTPQQAHQSQSNGEVQLLADWDNPEGRYVVHAEDAADEA